MTSPGSRDRRRQTLDELVDLARWMGHDSRDLAILAEGNVSASLGDDKFLVKASGVRLAEAGADGIVELTHSAVLDLVDAASSPTAEDTMQALADAVDRERSTGPGPPSIETMVHALCLGPGGASWVGHSHPTILTGLLCSARGAASMQTRIFPDEVVVCGPRSLLVPYADPGLPLARLVYQELTDHLLDYGEPPSVILLANHGLFALGESPAAVRAVTEMTVKAAAVRVTALLAGDLRPLPQDSIDDLRRRPDERRRTKSLLNDPGQDEEKR